MTTRHTGWVLAVSVMGCTFGSTEPSGSAGLGAGSTTDSAVDDTTTAGALPATTGSVGETADSTIGDPDDDDDSSSGDDDDSSGGDDDDDDDSSGGDDGPSSVCGDRVQDEGEDCDDANVDESDGCLSTCVVPHSCRHILDEGIDAPDGTYDVVIDGQPLEVYCDMTTDDGGWMLVAKVNPSDTDGTPESEPFGWFDMVLEASALTSPELALNAPLESLGASRLSPLLGDDSVARFQLIASDNPAVAVGWYKRVASASSFEGWFGADETASEVCLDVDMVQGCSMGVIDATGNACRLEGMHMADYGYEANWWVHMRLETNLSTVRQGVCSDTLNNQKNAWPDSYSSHWGNAMRIWLRE